MPYIPQDRRELLNYLERAKGVDVGPINIGELNFLITTKIEEYRAAYGDSYTVFNAIIGALECAKQEFYRKVVCVYEDEKAIANGEVYKPLKNKDQK